MNVAVPLVTNVLNLLATVASVSAADDAFQRKSHGSGVVRAGKEITFVFLMKMWMMLLE